MTKISISIVLIGVMADLFYAKINPVLPLLKGALTFSPVPYTVSLVEKDHLKTAEEYINFYSSIPGVTLSPEMQDLKNNIHSERHGLISGLRHQIKHIYKGTLGQETDEFVGHAADVAIDFTGAGDLRDLYTEYKNYSKGGDVDKLSVGLAAISLTMTLGEIAGSLSGIVTAGSSTAIAISMCEPIKKMCNGIRKALKFMNPKLKNTAQKLFEPVFKKITDAQLLNQFPINLNSVPEATWRDKVSDLAKLTDINKWKTYFKVNLPKISEIIKLANVRMAELSDVIKLASKDPRAVKLIVENADNVDSVKRLSKLALDLGEKGRDIFKFGGKNAIYAMETLGKEGKLSAETLKNSMRFGSNGLKAVAKGCFHSLELSYKLIHKYAPILWWFTLQWFFAKIPLWLAALFEALGLALLVKGWLGFKGET